MTAADQVIAMAAVPSEQNPLSRCEESSQMSGFVDSRTVKATAPERVAIQRDPNARMVGVFVDCTPRCFNLYTALEEWL